MPQTTHYSGPDRRLFPLLILLFALLAVAAPAAERRSISIAWDANSELDVAGYIVQYGTATEQFEHEVDVGLATTWTMAEPHPDRPYYFRVQAYNVAGLRSPFSSAVASPAPTTGPGPGPVAPVLPPASLPRMHVDLPAKASSVHQDFVVAGWALDLGATAEAGVDTVHVWAYPTPESGTPATFLGAATMGIPRPDVAAAFSAPRVQPSGFMLQVSSLPPGTYDVVAFAHSTVAGSFNNSEAVRVTVQPRASRPMMSMETPSPDREVPRTFLVGGWALDLASAEGAGIDTVHLWAYPSDPGQAPVFLGAAQVGVARPDVGAAFGAQFAGAGYHAFITLPPGRYDLAAFAFSRVAGSFNNAMLVPVIVR